MRRASINRISHRWLMAIASLALFAMAEESFVFRSVSADDSCMHRCLGDPDCRELAACGTAVSATCCGWGARVLLFAAAAKIAPNNHQKAPPAPFAVESTSLSLILTHSYRAGFSPDKAYSAGAGTATYLATARLRI